MKKDIASMAVAVLALALTACAPLQSTSAPAESSTPTATAAAELPAVSLETSCTFLFGTHLDGPIPDATDIINRFVANPDLSTISQEEVEVTLASLEKTAMNSTDDLEPFINATMEPLRTLDNALIGAKVDSVDFDNYKTAGIELINRCKPFIS